MNIYNEFRNNNHCGRTNKKKENEEKSYKFEVCETHAYLEC